VGGGVPRLTHSAVDKHAAALLNGAVNELDCGVEIGHQLLALLQNACVSYKLMLLLLLLLLLLMLMLLLMLLLLQHAHRGDSQRKQQQLALSSTSTRRYGMPAAPCAPSLSKKFSISRAQLTTAWEKECEDARRLLAVAGCGCGCALLL
jgi:hypothetical protein